MNTEQMIKKLTENINNILMLERLFIELNNYALLCNTEEVHEVNKLQNKVFEKLQSYKR